MAAHVAYNPPLRIPLNRILPSSCCSHVAATRSVLSSRRWASTYGAVVAGSGPAGVAVVGNLIEKNVSGRIAWVDPDFKGGRLNKKWREVPSNTKANLFVAFGEALEPFRKIIQKTSEPNAVSQLKKLKQDEGCHISYAADMCMMLTEGLRKHNEDMVEQRLGYVTGANWDDETSAWTVQIQEPSPNSSQLHTVQSKRVILCSGSASTNIPLPIPDISLQKVTLESALTPSELSTLIPKDSPSQIAVVGGSHSAVLVLLNLYNLARTTHPQLQVKWFTRSDLLYAEYKDGWILYDNTGLKGIAAEFARDNLEDDKLPNSDVGKHVQRFNFKNNERELYEQHLPQCTHIIHATGFTANPLPTLTRNGAPLKNIQYDHHHGGFVDGDGREVQGLFGAGIAFPERVTDPVGNTEYSVGMFKFMKYLKRVVEDWVRKPSSISMPMR